MKIGAKPIHFVTMDTIATPQSVFPATATSANDERLQDAPPQLSEAASRRETFDIRSIALTGLFVLAIFYTMYFMRGILLPFVLALLLSYVLRPIVRWLARLHMPPAFGAAIVIIGMVSVIGYTISALAAPAVSWLEKGPYSMQTIQSKLLPLRQPMQNVAKASGEIEKLTTPDNAPAKHVVEVKQHPITDMLFVRGPGLIVSGVLLLILLYFLLAYDGIFLTKVIKLLPTLTDKKHAVLMANEIEAHVSRYLFTVTLINIGLGVAVGATAGFLGLRNWVMWGVMVALLNFVPFLGALTGIICMTLGALLSFESVGYAFIFPAMYLVFAILEGNFITPLIMGRSLTLNPVMVLLSLTFWGWIWGIPGVILAVPILAAFKILCAHVKPIEPFAEFLS